MADWFYGKDNTQHGPISELEIRTLLSTGKIEASTIIWREGMPEWIPLQDAPEFNAPDHSQQTPQINQQYIPPAPTDNLAIISMVLGIISIIASCIYLGIIFGIPAVVLGHLSVKKINNSPVALGGKGLAIAGLITGYLGSIASLSIIAVAVFVYINI